MCWGAEYTNLVTLSHTPDLPILSPAIINIQYLLVSACEFKIKTQPLSNTKAFAWCAPGHLAGVADTGQAKESNVQQTFVSISGLGQAYVQQLQDIVRPWSFGPTSMAAPGLDWIYIWMQDYLSSESPSEGEEHEFPQEGLPFWLPSWELFW